MLQLLMSQLISEECEVSKASSYYTIYMNRSLGDGMKKLSIDDKKFYSVEFSWAL